MASSPAEALSTAVDGIEVRATLSPSRAGDFLSCPLKFRFKTVDKIAEPPSPAATRGTVVHKVLENLYTLPAGERVDAAAQQLVLPAWEEIVAADPELSGLFASSPGQPDPAVDFEEWLTQCRDAVRTYFALEDPQRLEPAERELYVETVLESRLLVRGFVDRLDIAPTGEIRIVDYKTGKAPRAGYEEKAFFQLKIYALVVWRIRGVIPTRLQLVYLGSGDILVYDPTEAELLSTERKIDAIGAAIEAAHASREWTPRRSALCNWCSFQTLCPEYGGTLPPYPES